MGLEPEDGAGRDQSQGGQLLLSPVGSPQLLRWEVHGEGELGLVSGPRPGLVLAVLRVAGTG